jgi:hypothetical protein
MHCIAAIDRMLKMVHWRIARGRQKASGGCESALPGGRSPATGTRMTSSISTIRHFSPTETSNVDT